MDRCAYCGEELNPNAHFCPNCGRPRAEAPQPEAAPEAPLAEAEYEIEEAEYVIEEAEDATAQPSERVDHVIVDRKQAPRPSQAPRPARETAPREEPAAPAEGYASRPEGYAARPSSYASRPEGDYAPQPAPKASGLSIAAFVCSLSLILCGLGAILAVVDLVKGKSQPRKKGLSVAALVISGVVLVMSFIGNTFLKAGLLAPKGETLNEIAAAAATKAPGTGAKPTAKATERPTAMPQYVTSTSRVTSIAYEGGVLAGLREDGTVALSNIYNFKNNVDTYHMDCSAWTDIVALAVPSSGAYVMGLKRDGTVVVTGQFDDGAARETKTWTNVISIAADDRLACGAHVDGTVSVVCVDQSKADDMADRMEEIRQWTDIESVKAYDTAYAILGRKKDGSWICSPNVVANRFALSWYAGASDLPGRNLPPEAALYPDGTVAIDPYYWGNDYLLPGWRGVRKLFAEQKLAIALIQDGTVVAASNGSNTGSIASDVLAWRDVADLAFDGNTAVGLKKDGSILISGLYGFTFDPDQWAMVSSQALQAARQSAQAAKPQLTPAPMAPTSPDIAEVQRAIQNIQENSRFSFYNSREDFINVLVREGYSEDAILLAIASVDLDWNAYAEKLAGRWTSSLTWSLKTIRQMLRKNLFTVQEIEYAVSRLHVDFKEMALEDAKKMLKYYPDDRKGMMRYLVGQGFTEEEAAYAADKLRLK